MTDYKSCGYTIQTELINLRIICVSSGDLSHILNELIHSAGPVKGSHVKPEKTQHMTEGPLCITLITFACEKGFNLKNAELGSKCESACRYV